MNTKIRRQLSVSAVMISLLLMTLVLWYDNFAFHTYMNPVNYQFCFDGETDDILIQGYNVFQNDNEQNYGGARIATKKQGLFLKGDKVKVVFQSDRTQETKNQFVHEYTLRDSDEVFYIDNQINKQSLSEDSFNTPLIELSVVRGKRVVFNQEIGLKAKDLVVYNGSNKDYTIQNISVSDHWMKTGNFSTTLENIVKEYPYMTIDYLLLKNDGNSEDINDYERFIYMKGKTQDFLNGKLSQSMIYDGEGSLLDRQMTCVIALSKNDKQEKPFTFKIDIHGNIKAGE